MFKSNSADVFNMSEIVVQVRQGHLLTNYDFEINLDFTLLNIPDRYVFNNVFLLMDAGYQIFERIAFIKNNPDFYFSGELVLVCKKIMNGLNLIANKNKAVAKKA